MNDKYVLTDEKKIFCGKTLYRIKALKSFEIQGFHVSAGDLGGWVESERNLSQIGNAWVGGDARVGGDAEIRSSTDYLLIGPIGSRDDFVTFFRAADDGIFVKCGCFLGSLDAFLAAVAKTHQDNEHAKAYREATNLAKCRILRKFT